MEDASTRRPRGRPSLPPDRAKRYAVGIRTTKQIKESLQTAADASGRSVAQEIELRLERSFDRDRTLADEMTEALGGPRTAALFQALAAQVPQPSEGERWLDDYNAFNAVRQMWDRTLDAMAPTAPEFALRVHNAVRTLSERVDDAGVAGELRQHIRTLIEALTVGTTPPRGLRAEGIQARLAAAAKKISSRQ